MEHLRQWPFLTMQDTDTEPPSRLKQAGSLRSQGMRPGRQRNPLRSIDLSSSLNLSYLADVWASWLLVIIENTIKQKYRTLWYWGNSQEGMRSQRGGDALLWNAELHMEMFRHLLKHVLLLGVWTSCLPHLKTFCQHSIKSNSEALSCRLDCFSSKCVWTPWG